MEQDQVQIVPIETVEATVRAEVDIQVSTAKKYPRNIEKSLNNAIAIATMDKETAQSCGYSLTFRGGKPITGKSVHLAKIIAQCWGNLRIEKKIIDANATHVISEATCLDLETNIAIRTQTRKSIVTKEGKRYSNDMIATVGMAAASISMRESILTVVPKSVSDKIYDKTRLVITGGLDNETKIIHKRKELIETFENKYGVKEDEILKVLAKGTINAIDVDDIVHLINIEQAIKDKEITINDAFGRDDKSKSEKIKNIYGGKEPEPEKPKKKTKKDDPVTVPNEEPLLISKELALGLIDEAETKEELSELSPDIEHLKDDPDIISEYADKMKSLD